MVALNESYLDAELKYLTDILAIRDGDYQNSTLNVYIHQETLLLYLCDKFNQILLGKCWVEASRIQNIGIKVIHLLTQLHQYDAVATGSIFHKWKFLCSGAPQRLQHFVLADLRARLFDQFDSVFCCHLFVSRLVHFVANTIEVFCVVPIGTNETVQCVPHDG